jgi:aminopeptidase N
MIGPYFPRRGNDGYRITHYDLDLDYRVGNNRMAATARLTVRTEAAELSAVVLDFASLRVDRVTLAGAKLRFEHRDEKLRVRLPRLFLAGNEFVLEVAYRGEPKPTASRYGGLGWEQLEDGVLVASQPTGAPSWFPCNDRPDHKSGYRFRVTTSTNYQVAANGEPAGVSYRGSNATWTYVQDVPMATYLATVQIGPYQMVELDSSRSSVVQRLVTPLRRLPAARDAFASQDAMMAYFSEAFGPYPFAAYTAVVTDDTLDIPIEAQGMSTFGANHADRGWPAQRMIAHELAHQWFGNSLTLGDWCDIWLHEGFASYAEWLWSQESGGKTADEHARNWHRQLSRMPRDFILGDPGPADLFDDRVYKRGALTLHALRLTIGDDLFFRLIRIWTVGYQYGTVSTREFEDLAEATAGRGLGEFFEGWLREERLPELPQLPEGRRRR